jgi:nitroimidazol reductase NimA-like FMN-containing flavoprotein (pyridoxamine 5'-phosphate oxidase superfamily)
MDIVENTLGVDVESFLKRPLFCFLGTVDGGDPRVTPLWFLWEDGAAWIIANDEKTYPTRIRNHSAATMAVVDFDRASGRVQHVGMRGTAEVRPHDPERAVRLLEPYLDPDPEAWDDERFGDPFAWGEEMVFLRFDPETVVARDQSYAPSPAVRE